MQRTLLALSLAVAWCLSLTAQTPPAAQAPSANAPEPVFADLNQLMRGVLYPAANVVFSAQADNPGEVKFVPGHDPTMSTDPLTSTFGGWVAVENAALALAESASLLSIAGRACSNGVPVPTKDPAWAAFLQQLRDVSMQSYKAAKAKDQDKMIELSSTLSTACNGCHRKWRDRRTPENRCK
jgi:hypothetical protein